MPESHSRDVESLNTSLFHQYENDVLVLGNCQLQVFGSGLLGHRHLKCQKKNGGEFTWDDLVLLARFGVQPAGFHTPFLHMLQLSGKCRAMVYDSVLQNQTKLPNFKQMEEALDGFDNVVLNVVQQCQEYDEANEGALYDQLNQAVKDLRIHLISKSRGLYVIQFFQRILVLLEGSIKETEEGLFLSQVSGTLLQTSHGDLTSLEIEVSSSEVLCRRELQRLVLALSVTNDQIDANNYPEKSLSLYCPSQIPSLRSTLSVTLKKHLLDSFLVVGSFWLSSLVNPDLQQSIDLSSTDVIDSAPSWCVWSSGIVITNAVLSLAASCVKPALPHAVFIDLQERQRESNNIIEKMQSRVMRLLKMVQQHKTPADQYVVAFGDIAHRLSDTAVDSWVQVRLCYHLACLNMPFLSQKSKLDRLHELMGVGSDAQLNAHNKALVRHLLMKNERVNSCDKKILTRSQVQKLMTMLAGNKPECARSSMDVNLAQPFYVLGVKELAHSMYIQNISSGTQGALGVLLSLAMGYNCVMYEHGVGRSFGQVFSNGFVWELFSSMVMSWQLFVALVPAGSESVSARFYGFLWRNAMPLVSGLSLLHDVAWLAKQHIPFLADEVQHKAGKIEAIFLMGVFVKMSVLVSLFLSSKEGESVVMRSVFALVHTVSLLVGSMGFLFLAKLHNASESLSEALSFILNGVLLGTFKGLLQLPVDMATMLIRGGVALPFSELVYDSCRLMSNVGRVYASAGQSSIAVASNCVGQTQRFFSRCKPCCIRVSSSENSATNEYSILDA